MSQENVEIVRRIYDGMARRDAATVLGLYDAELEWDSSRTIGSLMGGRIYHGHDGLRTFFREWYEAWGNVEYGFGEFTEVGDRVVFVATQRARARVSGAEVAWEMAGVWTIRDGKVHRVVWYPTLAEALEAVGLSE